MVAAPDLRNGLKLQIPGTLEHDLMGNGAVAAKDAG